MDLRLVGVWSSDFASRVAQTRASVRQARILAREYKRDADGQFSSGGGGDDEDFEDGSVNEPDVNPYNDGQDVSEYDLDENGGARFSSSYRERYGSVTNEYGIGANNDHTVTVTSKRSRQVTDDSGGTMSREVVQEFTPAGARSLSEKLYNVNDWSDPGGMDRKTGVTVTPNGRVGQVTTREGEDFVGADVTFANGKTVSFDGDEIGELAESLGFAADD